MSEIERAPLVTSHVKGPISTSSSTGILSQQSRQSSLTGSPCHRPTEKSTTGPRARKALTFAIGFCFCFMLVEFACGIVTHSLALLNDAAHMITDVANLSMSLVAVHATEWAATSKYSYGWKRMEVVGALASLFTTWALVVWIFVEAIQRIIAIIECADGRAPDAKCFRIDSELMLYIGVTGFLANVCCAFVLHWGGHHGHSHGSLGGGGHGHHDHGHGHGHGHGHSATSETESGNCGGHGHHHHAESSSPCTPQHGGGGNMNLRGAFLHVIGDCLQSLGVVLAAAVIWGFNKSEYGDSAYPRSYYNLADPCCSILFGVITIFTTKGLWKDVWQILMECTPKGIEHSDVEAALLRIPAVTSVEDLHIWALGSEGALLSSHMNVDSTGGFEQHSSLLQAAAAVCEEHGITHTTFQVHFHAPPLSSAPLTTSLPTATNDDGIQW